MEEIGDATGEEPGLLLGVTSSTDAPVLKTRPPPPPRAVGLIAGKLMPVLPAGAASVAGAEGAGAAKVRPLVATGCVTEADALAALAGGKPALDATVGADTLLELGLALLEEDVVWLLAALVSCLPVTESDLLEDVGAATGLVTALVLPVAALAPPGPVLEVGAEDESGAFELLVLAD